MHWPSYSTGGILKKPKSTGEMRKINFLSDEREVIGKHQLWTKEFYLRPKIKVKPNDFLFFNDSLGTLLGLAQGRRREEEVGVVH